MTLSIYALVAVTVLGGLVASESAIGQDLSASVAIDALGTARQLASEGRLQDALHIAYLVQRLPDLTEDESERCRRLLAQCQSLAISVYVEPDEPQLRQPMELPATQDSPADEAGEEPRFVPRSDMKMSAIDRVDPRLTAGESGSPTRLGAEPQSAAPPDELASQVPRLLSDHNQDASLLFPPRIVSPSFPTGRLPGVSSEETPNWIHREASGMATPIPPQSDLRSTDASSQSSQDANGEAGRNAVSQSFTGSMIESAQRWPLEVPFPQAMAAWMLVSIGLLAGTGGRWLLTAGLLAIRVFRPYFRRPASVPLHYSGQRSFASTSHEKDGRRFSDICSRIADDNRRLR